jgi:hypothetical protein
MLRLSAYLGPESLPRTAGEAGLTEIEKTVQTAIVTGRAARSSRSGLKDDLPFGTISQLFVQAIDFR